MDRATEVAIVGAGVAGLAAADALRAAGREVAVLEAKERIGGRAYTRAAAPGIAFDHGCHWLHAARRNPLARFARDAGWAIENHAVPRRIRRDGRWLDDAEVAAWEAFTAAQFARIERAGRARDAAAAAALATDPRWDALFAAWFAMINGVEPPAGSTLDHARYVDTGDNWRLGEGYGSLVAERFRAVPVTLGSPVAAIDWTAEPVLAVPGGRLRARAVLVTVSTGVLGGGAIRFSPPLPAWKQDAVAGLPMGHAERLAFVLADDAPGLPGAACSGFSQLGGEVVSFQIRPFGWPAVVGYLGGHLARTAGGGGPERVLEVGRRHLAHLLGPSAPEQVRAAVASAWTRDPHVRGAYSAARPGRARAREALARPLADRVFFAGEATSSTFYSTAHGAYLSGRSAAAAILAALRAGR